MVSSEVIQPFAAAVTKTFKKWSIGCLLDKIVG